MSMKVRENAELRTISAYAFELLDTFIPRLTETGVDDITFFSLGARSSGPTIRRDCVVQELDGKLGRFWVGLKCVVISNCEYLLALVAVIGQ